MAHNPWSFAPYSQTFASGDILYEQITAVETIRCVCGIGDVEDETADARARILCRIKASAAMPETAEGGAYILAAAAMTADAPEHAEASVRIAGRAMLGADAGESADAAGQIAASICIGVLVFQSTDAVAQIGMVLSIGADVREHAAATEIVSCLSRMDATSQEIITAAVTIPPGKTLVIDAHDYTATLDGENVLHLVDAFPMLDDRVKDVYLDAGIGGILTGILQYRERWY